MNESPKCSRCNRPGFRDNMVQVTGQIVIGRRVVSGDRKWFCRNHALDELRGQIAEMSELYQNTGSDRPTLAEVLQSGRDRQ